MKLGINLKISQRIFLPAMIAISGFVLFFIYQQHLISQTQSHIVRLQQDYTPMLSKLGELKEGLITLERNLDNFVTTGDKKLIAESEALSRQLKQLINTIEHDGDKLGFRYDYLSPFSTYADNKLFAAQAMSDEDADFDVITLKSKQANDAIANLRAEINRELSTINRKSNETVDTIFKINTESQTVELILGIVIVLMTLAGGYFISRNIVNSLARVTLSMRDIVEGEGDLTRRVEYSGKDEIADLVNWFNQFIATMQNSIGSSQQTIAALEAVSTKLANTSEHSVSQIESQNVAMNSVSNAIQALTNNIGDIADRASNASTEAELASESAKTGRLIVSSTVDSIDQLSTDVNNAAGMVNEFETLANNAGDILNTISAIADQTNLLALNAAIEAARAGEFGRGFSVVADEVRALASRTQSSTAEIKHVLEEIQSGAASVISAMNAGQQSASNTVSESAKAGQSLSDITAKFENILALNKMIANATDEQRDTYNEMNAQITDIDTASIAVQNGAKNIFAVSEEIQEVTLALNNVISQYKV
ncbi:methyl-accepting chemotaxis protein [Thalassotalea montiporae]